MATASVDLGMINVSVQHSGDLQGLYGYVIKEGGAVKEDRIIKGDRGIATVYLCSRLERWLPFLSTSDVMEIASSLVGYATIDLEMVDDDYYERVDAYLDGLMDLI